MERPSWETSPMDASVLTKIMRIMKIPGDATPIFSCYRINCQETFKPLPPLCDIFFLLPSSFKPITNHRTILFSHRNIIPWPRQNVRGLGTMWHFPPRFLKNAHSTFLWSNATGQFVILEALLEATCNYAVLFLKIYPQQFLSLFPNHSIPPPSTTKAVLRHLPRIKLPPSSSFQRNIFFSGDSTQLWSRSSVKIPVKRSMFG